jgi:hypothetical protein
MKDNHSLLLVVKIAVVFHLILGPFLRNSSLILRNFYLYPFLYLFHCCQSIQFLVALIRVNHSFDFLHPTQDLE